MNKQLICKDCGYEGKPVNITKGSFFLEVVLWLCFLIPGIIYSCWRLTTRYQGCPECGGKMIPLDSKLGKKIAKENKEDV